MGLYHWIVEARDGTDVYVVDEGYMEVKTDFAEQTSGYDDRSVTKKMVDGSITKHYFGFKLPN